MRCFSGQGQYLFCRRRQQKPASRVRAEDAVKTPRFWEFLEGGGDWSWADLRSKFMWFIIMLSSSWVLCCAALCKCVSYAVAGVPEQRCWGEPWKSDCDRSHCTLWPLPLCCLLFYLTTLSCVRWCLLQDRPWEENEVGIWREISMLQALFILSPDFSSRCFGALADRDVRKKRMCVSSRKGVGLPDVADFI